MPARQPGARRGGEDGGALTERLQEDLHPLLSGEPGPAENGAAVYRLAGEIDMSTRDAMLERLLSAADAAGDGLVVDLTDVAFIDSSGLKALIMVREDLMARGLALRIRGAHGSVLRLFQLTSMEELLEN